MFKKIGILVMVMVIVGLTCQMGYTLEIVTNPAISYVTVGSGQISFQVQGTVTEGRFDWELIRGSGELLIGQDRERRTQVFYIPPNSIENSSEEVIITVKHSTDSALTNKISFMLVKRQASSLKPIAISTAAGLALGGGVGYLAGYNIGYDAGKEDCPTCPVCPSNNDCGINFSSLPNKNGTFEAQPADNSLIPHYPANTPIAWTPPSVKMAVEVYQNFRLLDKRSAYSGELRLNDFRPSSGLVTQIKLWIDGMDKPSAWSWIYVD